MSGSEAIEVEVALARDQDCLVRAAFYAPAVVSLGSSAEALLQFDDPALGPSHDVLEISEQGAFLLVAEGMELQLVRGEERATLDSLRADGLAIEQDGAWRVELAVGANAVLSAGEANLMLKCRCAPATDERVMAAGAPPAFACGKCGADLQFVIDSPGALSPCPRCSIRNRVAPSDEAEAEQEAASPDQELEAAQEPEPSPPDRPPSLGPEGTDADLLIGLAVAVAPEAGEGPTDLGLGEDRQDDAEDFEEEATEPGISPARLRKAARSQLQAGAVEIERLGEDRQDDAEEASGRPKGSEAADDDSRPRRRRRRKKHRSPSPWTPRLVSLIVVGLVSGALGLGMIFYAVVIRAAGG